MIYAIATQKGGTGKTTTAHALAAGLAQAGHKVLAVDLDAQRNLTTVMQGSADAATVYDVLTGSATALEAIQHTTCCDLLPAAKGMNAADTVLTDTGKEYKLKEALDPVKGAYDFIVIDTPPALGALTVNALTAADRVIIPMQTDGFSIDGVEDLREAVQTVKKYCNPALEIGGILLTRYDSRTILAREMLEKAEALAMILGVPLYGTIREAVAVKEAQMCRTDIFTYAGEQQPVYHDFKAFIEQIEKGGK